MESNTKAFTAVVLLRAVSDGRIRLDDPVGLLDAAPWFTQVEHVTVRQLLNHTSGIVSYRDVPEFGTDPESFDSWEKALRTVQAVPPKFAPGEGVWYSSTNFVLAGLLAEQVYGRPIEALLTEMLSEVGLSAIDIRGPAPASPATGTGGSYGTIDDLARFAIAQWRDQILLSPEMNTLTQTIDPQSMMAPGTLAYCPCVVDPEGRQTQAAVGYHGGTSTMRYFRASDTVVVVHVNPSIWDEGTPAALEALMSDLATS